MTVTIYTRPLCQPCRATKRMMQELEIEFEEVNLEDLSDFEIGVLIESFGAKEAPVVLTPDSHWSGFRPDKIKEIQR